MDRIAVDVVLLPDAAVTELAVRLNRALVREFGSAIVLDPETCLPHISLAMGCIDRPAITAIAERLPILMRRSPVTTLHITGIAVTANSIGQKVSSFAIKKTADLQAMHEAVMRDVGPSLGHDVDASMIYDGIAAETALQWIRNYPEQAAHDRFFPHITLGYGQASTAMTFPIPFPATRLALCHLGNHCTCRKVLASVQLQ
jgi:2'-5' RNA ligase